MTDTTALYQQIEGLLASTEWVSASQIARDLDVDRARVRQVLARMDLDYSTDAKGGTIYRGRK